MTWCDYGFFLCNCRLLNKAEWAKSCFLSPRSCCVAAGPHGQRSLHPLVGLLVVRAASPLITVSLPPSHTEVSLGLTLKNESGRSVSCVWERETGRIWQTLLLTCIASFLSYHKSMGNKIVGKIPSFGRHQNKMNMFYKRSREQIENKTLVSVPTIILKQICKLCQFFKHLVLESRNSRKHWWVSL